MPAATARSRTNPTTKASRLKRAAELTERIDARLAEVETLSEERNAVVSVLRKTDGATYREIGEAIGKSEQAVHKAFTKVRAVVAKKAPRKK